MGWADLPADQTTDWTSWAFRAQFGLALHERQVACGLAELPTPDYDFEADWDAHGLEDNAFSVRQLQADVEHLLEHGYVRAQDYAGLSSPPWGVPGGRGFVYRREDFWTDAATPAGGVPTEDLDDSGTSPATIYSPAILDGGRYAVDAPATGDWAGHAGQIAVATAAGEGFDYDFETPADDALVYVEARRLYLRRDADAADWAAADDVGWTRKFPRAIARITDDGTEGQRARLAGTGTNLNANATRFLGVRIAPPAVALTGAFYGVQADATGAWAGQDGKLAAWDGEDWAFTAVGDGDQYLF
ncbi:MAG TPA: DUF2793 domain-containing protein, partial [Phycisphaerae bacterium]|nr:DUF2793 domain-containing protein [Phycisphaerae bacterium]